MQFRLIQFRLIQFRLIQFRLIQFRLIQFIQLRHSQEVWTSKHCKGTAIFLFTEKYTCIKFMLEVPDRFSGQRQFEDSKWYVHAHYYMYKLTFIDINVLKATSKICKYYSSTKWKKAKINVYWFHMLYLTILTWYKDGFSPVETYQVEHLTINFLLHQCKYWGYFICVPVIYQPCISEGCIYINTGEPQTTRHPQSRKLENLSNLQGPYN